MPKILIVDDEPKIRKIYRELLTCEGYQVAEAENGDIADILLVEGAIDLVLLDLSMPVVDGPALFNMLRHHKPELKVIVTSVYSIDDQKRKVSDADDYFDKSQNTAALVESVKKLLSDFDI